MDFSSNFKNLNDIALKNIIEDEAEFFPLLSAEDEDMMGKTPLPSTLPILPLRNTVLFPGVVIPITVSRDKSIKLIRDAYKSSKIIGVVSQIKGDIEDPTTSDLYTVGTEAYIIKVLQMPDGSSTVIIQGRKRFKIDTYVSNKPYYTATVLPYEDDGSISDEASFQALISSLKDISIQIIKQSPNIPSETAFAIKNIESPVFLVNFISSNLSIEIHEKQQLLEQNNLYDRAQQVLAYLTKELQMLELKNQIQSKVKIDIDKQQRDYFLSQQLKTIQEELGGNPHEQDIQDFKEKAKLKKWSKEVEEVFNKELQKFQRMNPAAAEHSIQMGYLQCLLELPWGEFTEDNLDLKNVQKVLDEDHFGLEKIKERIIEYLAVLKLKKDMKSPILCLVGPPGVGKTSLGKSIARALGRNYVRMSLGGLRDEAEIRGHRKTYIGAMPGRIIQSLRKAKSSNPVFVLDEIDKVSHNNFTGDPSSALLEVLDPEQNIAFYDNYLEIDYDLSNVMFIATANTLQTIQPALIDRMEIIDVSGYLVEEKIEIAKHHLIPKQLKEHGLQKKHIKFSDKIIENIIDYYTRESGVRNLERNLAKIIRYKARFIANEEPYNKNVSNDELQKILGVSHFKRDHYLNGEVAGVVTGLAWTSVGGEILFVEVSLSKGKGNLTVTGNLGEVMKESAVLAFEYLKSHHEVLKINPMVFDHWNVHIHVPEGATPKDGPSAGITMFTALASAFTQRKVKPHIAMTGEITLRGKVLPVGGIKEKILAAKRSDIKEIILPAENKKDIEEINQKYLEGIEFHYINEMIELIDLALLKSKVKNPLDLNNFVSEKK